MPTISTTDYLLDQAKRRFTTVAHAHLPRHGRWSRSDCWPTTGLSTRMAEPPAGSDLKPVMGDAGLPIIGHMIELFRGGPDYLVAPVPQPRTSGAPRFADHCPTVAALGPDADSGDLLQPQQGLLAAGLGSR